MGYYFKELWHGAARNNHPKLYNFVHVIHIPVENKDNNTEIQIISIDYSDFAPMLTQVLMLRLHVHPLHS